MKQYPDIGISCSGPQSNMKKNKNGTSANLSQHSRSPKPIAWALRLLVSGGISRNTKLRFGKCSLEQSLFLDSVNLTFRKKGQEESCSLKAFSALVNCGPAPGMLPLLPLNVPSNNPSEEAGRVRQLSCSSSVS